MSIDLLAEPTISGSGAPTVESDWELLVEQKRALALRSDNAPIVDWESLIIPQGSVINVGGAMYLATSDTAINGTESEYIYFVPSGDASTLTPTFASSLTGVTWNKEYNGWYDTSNQLYVFKTSQPANVHIARYESSGTFIVPPGITEIYITGCASGGNGSAGKTVGSYAGGGGGESAFKVPLAVTPASSLSIVIGGNGVDTSVGSSFTLVHGGNATGATPGAGGSGGSGSVDGGTGGSSSHVDGYSGYSMGGNGNSTTIATTTCYFGGGGGGFFGHGGAGTYGSDGGGGGATLASGVASGGDGDYGSGGGGCLALAGTPTAGQGGPALIIIEW